MNRNRDNKKCTRPTPVSHAGKTILIGIHKTKKVGAYKRGFVWLYGRYMPVLFIRGRWETAILGY